MDYKTLHDLALASLLFPPLSPLYLSSLLFSPLTCPLKVILKLCNHYPIIPPLRASFAEVDENLLCISCKVLVTFL